MVEITTDTGTIQKIDANSGIWCDGLRLYAYGEIGTDENPLNIYSNGIFQSSGGGIMRSLFRAAPVAENVLVANSVLYGENVNIIPVRTQSTGNNTGTGSTIYGVYGDGVITVSGSIEEGAVLQVSYVSDHVDCPVCKLLVKQSLLEGRRFVNLKILGNYAGKLLVQIPVSEELAECEGNEVLVLTCREGVVWAIRATVIDGYISFYTTELGPFLVLDDPTQLELTEDGTKIILDQQILPFGGWI